MHGISADDMTHSQTIPARDIHPLRLIYMTVRFSFQPSFLAAYRFFENFSFDDVSNTSSRPPRESEVRLPELAFPRGYASHFEVILAGFQGMQTSLSRGGA